MDTPVALRQVLVRILHHSLLPHALFRERPLFLHHLSLLLRHHFGRVSPRRTSFAPLLTEKNDLLSFHVGRLASGKRATDPAQWLVICPIELHGSISNSPNLFNFLFLLLVTLHSSNYVPAVSIDFSVRNGAI